tara:strand:+ start:356 stop:532 length:177 start_codon:yes stop_codon:yes gene_type:complete
MFEIGKKTVLRAMRRPSTIYNNTTIRKSTAKFLTTGTSLHGNSAQHQLVAIELISDTM